MAMDPAPFRPGLGLATPRSIRGLITTSPRVIADDVWAKLLWAGLNLTPGRYACQRIGQLLPDEDDPGDHPDLDVLRAARRDPASPGGLHPVAHNGFPIPRNSPGVLAKDVICLLDVPVKTGSAFSKPVEPLLGQAI